MDTPSLLLSVESGVLHYGGCTWLQGGFVWPNSSYDCRGISTFTVRGGQSHLSLCTAFHVFGSQLAVPFMIAAASVLSGWKEARPTMG